MKMKVPALYPISKRVGKLGLELVPPKYFLKNIGFKILSKSLDLPGFLDTHLLKP